VKEFHLNKSAQLALLYGKVLISTAFPTEKDNGKQIASHHGERTITIPSESKDIAHGRKMFGKRTLMVRLRREFRYLRGLMRHPRTPRCAVCLIGAGLGYLVSPVDLIPDFIPILGQLDDAVVVGFCIGLALLLTPADVKASTRQRSQLRTMKGIVLPSSPFETEALPWEFGVRIMPKKQTLPKSALAFESMIELLMQNHLVVADINVQRDVIAPNGLRTYRGLHVYPQTPRQQMSPYLYLDPSFTRGEVAVFIDLMAAHAGLSEPVKARLEFLHLYGAASIDGGIRNLQLPVVVTHPFTGEKCLNANIFKLDARAICPARTRLMLDFLRDHARHPSFQYVHRFKPNEIVVWDGISVTQNAAASRDTGDALTPHAGYCLTPSLPRLPAPIPLD
jgi:uncharacterized membrane protein YkvA (DUF1232 family)